MSDSLERLKNKNRPVVENRDASLAPIVIASTSPDTSISRMPQEEKPQESVEVKVKTQEQALQPQIETKQSTLRLETGISQRLQTLCRAC